MSQSDYELVEHLRHDIELLKDSLDKSRLSAMGKSDLTSEGKDVKEIRSFNLKERRTLRGHFGKVYALSWCPNDETPERLASASQDGSIIVWNSITGSKLRMVRLASQWVMSVAYSPSGTLVASGGLDNVVSGFKYQTKGLLEQKPQIAFPDLTLTHHQGYISCTRFVSDDQIVTSSGDSTVVLWDVTKQKPVTVFEGHDSDVMTVTGFGQNGTLVSGACDCTAKVWDTRSGKCEQTHEGHESDVNSIDRFPDGYGFGTASDDNTCRLFDTRCWGEIASFADEKLSSATSCAFSPSGRLFFAGYDDHSVRVWDTLKCRMIDPVNGLTGHEKRVSCLGISSNGYALAAGSWDDSLKLWA
jgi:guanine nucleotide-binding protein G(I)/G(S)/G(T) subunit beta-1